MQKFVVRGQTIETLRHDPIASGQIQFVKLEFAFEGSWKELHKVVQFQQCDETFNQVLGVEGTSCMLPSELHPGPVKMSAFGYATSSEDALRATTVPVTMNIKPSGFCEDSTDVVPPTPDLYQQIIAKMKGDSAYEVAVKNGFKGTEQEWLDSLHAGTEEFAGRLSAVEAESSGNRIAIEVLENRLEATALAAVQYVDPVNGNDDNDGFTPEAALKTIRSALEKKLINLELRLASHEFPDEGYIECRIPQVKIEPTKYSDVPVVISSEIRFADNSIRIKNVNFRKTVCFLRSKAHIVSGKIGRLFAESGSEIIMYSSEFIDYTPTGTQIDKDIEAYLSGESMVSVMSALSFVTIMWCTDKRTAEDKGCTVWSTGGSLRFYGCTDCTYGVGKWRRHLDIWVNGEQVYPENEKLETAYNKANTALDELVEAGYDRIELHKLVEALEKAENWGSWEPVGQTDEKYCECELVSIHGKHTFRVLPKIDPAATNAIQFHTMGLYVPKVVIDSELSETSTNPVANSTICSEFEAVNDRIDAIETGGSDYAYLYVSRNGSDSNDGLSMDSPYKTIAKALEYNAQNISITLMDEPFEEETLRVGSKNVTFSMFNSTTINADDIYVANGGSLSIGIILRDDDRWNPTAMVHINANIFVSRASLYLYGAEPAKKIEAESAHVVLDKCWLKSYVDARLSSTVRCDNCNNQYSGTAVSVHSNSIAVISNHGSPLNDVTYEAVGNSMVFVNGIQMIPSNPAIDEAIRKSTEATSNVNALGTTVDILSNNVATMQNAMATKQDVATVDAKVAAIQADVNVLKGISSALDSLVEV